MWMGAWGVIVVDILLEAAVTVARKSNESWRKVRIPEGEDFGWDIYRAMLVFWLEI